VEIDDKGKVVVQVPDKVDDAWIAAVQKLPAEKQVEAVAKKLKELNPNFTMQLTPTYEGALVKKLRLGTDDVSDIRPLRALPSLTELDFSHDTHWGKGKLADLEPLRGLRLKHLELKNNPRIQDVGPLTNMPMEYLDLTGTAVSDLSPVNTTALTLLNVSFTPVSDLTALRGVRLTHLYASSSRIADLSPIKDAPLRILWCDETAVSDLSPLRGKAIWSFRCQKSKVQSLAVLQSMPLKDLACDFDPRRDTEILLAIKSLEKINGVDAADFLKTASPADPVFEQWVKETQKLPPEKQLAAVVKKLQERNPGFDGKVTHKLWDGVVREVQFFTDHVTDLSPVRAFKDLRQLVCNGTDIGKGKLADLSPVRGMDLTLLYVHWNPGVKDLEVVRGMRLKELNIGGTGVVDLAPLAGMPLERLYCGWSPADLTTLRDIHLTQLNGNFPPAVFRPFWSLETINDRPMLEYWRKHDPKHAALLEWIAETKKLPPEKQVEAVVKKLRELNPDFDGRETHKVNDGVVKELKFNTDAVSDLRPVRALPQLRHLECRGSVRPDGQPLGKVASLTALEGMGLYVLACSGNPIADLSPIKNTPINTLAISNTSVTDLKPLEGMPLVMLDCAMNDGRKLFDLTPVRKAPLKELYLVFRPERHLEILKSIPTLTKINGKPATEVLTTTP
jgi:Leucine-rich repeat (LRR) protein